MQAVAWRMKQWKGMHYQIFAARNMTLSSAKEKFPSRWGNRDTRKFIVREQEILNPEVKKSA